KECLINTVKTSGKLHSASGIDFIVFKKYSLKKIPPFIVGRPYWDGWMLWWASWLGLDLIDITLMTKIIHQNHDYSHMGGLKNILNGKEYESNKSLAGNWLFRYNIKYANKILTADGVKNKFKFKSFFIFYRIFLLSISAITMGLSSPLKRYKPYIKSILQYNTRIYKLIFP
ncbi:MAG: hypothetical protein OEZ01_17450, partial [Candidatus Heimdallarchaeota archaeon]|nr:hypothetical protein [Candidatus Heimdallarchaeota archaeon]